MKTNTGRDLEFLVMAVTRLATGVCVAGITKQRQWIRPTRQVTLKWRQLEAVDLTNTEGDVVVQVGNVVRWRMYRPIPENIHTEDFAIYGPPPALVRHLGPSPFLKVCEEIVEPDWASFLTYTNRSLCLIQPDRINSIVFNRKGKGEITAEVLFEHEDQDHHFKVTDLAWRAMGRRLLDEHQAEELYLRTGRLRRQTGLTIRYLGIGRGREFQGKHWPFVISVVCVPLNKEPIDYRQC